MTNHVSRPSIDDSEAITAARNQINQIDEKLIDLLRQRFQTSALIGKIKETANLPVLDSGREQQVLERVVSLDPDPTTEKYLRNIFEEILKNSRDYQHDLAGDDVTDNDIKEND
ncbi:chorismate mutase [Lentilactobacillus parabuchneri]